MLCKSLRFLLQVLDEQLTDLLRCLPDNPAMHEKVGVISCLPSTHAHALMCLPLQPYSMTGPHSPPLSSPPAQQVLDAVFSLPRAGGPPTALEAPGAPIPVQARRGKPRNCRDILSMLHWPW